MRPPRWARWAARLPGSTRGGSRPGLPPLPPRRPAPSSVARAAFYLVAPGCVLREREPRGCSEPGPPLAPPSWAPPCGCRAGRGWRSLRRRGAGRRRGRSRGRPPRLAPPPPPVRAPLAGVVPPPALPLSRSLSPLPVSPPPWHTASLPFRPHNPPSSSGGVDTCSTENSILQTFIEHPPGARRCARGQGFKDDQGRDSGFEDLPSWGWGPVGCEGNSL